LSVVGFAVAVVVVAAVVVVVSCCCCCCCMHVSPQTPKKIVARQKEALVINASTFNLRSGSFESNGKPVDRTTTATTSDSRPASVRTRITSTLREQAAHQQGRMF
jgi:hypothetical protein